MTSLHRVAGHFLMYMDILLFHQAVRLLKCKQYFIVIIDVSEMGMEAVPEFVRYPKVKWMTLYFHNKLPLKTDGILEVKVITKPVDYSNQLLLRWNFQNKTFYETHGLPRDLSSIHI